MKTILALGAALAFAVAAPASAAELVTNGGFETADFTGWTQSGNTGFTGVYTAPYAHTGNYGAGFGAVGSTGSISQTLNTVAGQSYAINVWAANFGAGTNYGAISFDGVVLGSLTNAPVSSFTNYAWSVIASGSNSVLTFTFQNDPSYWALDDVSVSGVAGAVPEPATWGLMILGFGAIGAAARRRSGTLVLATA